MQSKIENIRIESERNDSRKNQVRVVENGFLWKKKTILVLMLFIALFGSYNDEVKAVDDSGGVELLNSGNGLSAPNFTVILRDQTVDLGNSVTMSAFVTGNPAPTIVVKHNGEPLETSAHVQWANNNGIITITIGIALQEDSGVYEIIAENSQGSKTTDCYLTVVENN